MCCYLTRTTNRTHQLIEENLHETPTYGGWVEAKGPRYCPSIEDKVNFICIIHIDSVLFSFCKISLDIRPVDTLLKVQTKEKWW